MAAADSHRDQALKAMNGGPTDVAVEDYESDTPRVFVALSWLVLAFLLLPVGVVVLTSLNAGEYLTFPPQGLSLRWIGNFFQTDTLRRAYIYSFQVGFMTALIATPLGTAAAMVLARQQFLGRSVLQVVFMSPILLPGVVIGFALFVYYLALQNIQIPLARSVPGLVMGHVVITTPFVTGTVIAGLHGLDRALEEAARSLGASAFYTFRKITLPLLFPSISAGFLFAFIVSFGQFDTSLFLSTPNASPLPVAMYYYLRYQFDPTPAAAGTFAIVLVIVSMILINRLTPLGKMGGIRFR